VLVTGGDDSSLASIFNVSTQTWVSAAHMVEGRGYQVHTNLRRCDGVITATILDTKQTSV